MLHDEGTVLGVRSAGQSEEGISYKEAESSFVESVKKLDDLLDLLTPAPSVSIAIPANTSAVRRYRPDTAFIMMWISNEHPELEDVKNTFKEVFKQFGVNALRSDEIEHQDVITTRILEEIETSEFLIADLSGERPSVYYEIGFAHALGKRPILFRRKGTNLHFDLSVHNVPEYENLTDLRQKLHKRLSVLTNKELKDVK